MFPALETLLYVTVVLGMPILSAWRNGLAGRTYFTWPSKNPSVLYALL